MSDASRRPARRTVVFTARWPWVVAAAVLLALVAAGAWETRGGPAPARAAQVLEQGGAGTCSGVGCIQFHTPPNGSILPGASVMFAWSTDPAYAFGTTFEFTVTPQGMAPIVCDGTNPMQCACTTMGATTSCVVTGLPTDGRAIQAVVRSFFSEK